jgi:antitoxin (DNA-binding transcriptional repressor) of toxin-antitoxin stability system
MLKRSEKMSEVPVAEFKRNFHTYAAHVLSGRSIRVVRHGRPVGDFVPVGPRWSASALPAADRPGGLIALAGLFSDWNNMEADIKDITASRLRAGQRAAPKLD